MVATFVSSYAVTKADLVNGLGVTRNQEKDS